MLPLFASPDGSPLGCAILGTNPRLLLDPAYRDFLDLVARQIAQKCQWPDGSDTQAQHS